MRSINQNIVFECLRELSDKKTQEVLWLFTDNGEVSSLIEVVEQLFTDSGLDDALSTSDVIFSSKIDDNLRTLSHLLARVDKKLPPAKIIGLPVMDEVRAMCKNILNLLENM